jgi:hypothetical protein
MEPRMNINPQEEKERLIGFEIMRLLDLSRKTEVGGLLDAALAGREKTIESVVKLYNFILRNFGEGITTAGSTGSSTTDKFWAACSEFLGGSGVTDEELSKIRYPHPLAGSPGFRSVLDEMAEEGRY